MSRVGFYLAAAFFGASAGYILVRLALGLDFIFRVLVLPWWLALCLAFLHGAIAVLFLTIARKS